MRALAARCRAGSARSLHPVHHRGLHGRRNRRHHQPPSRGGARDIRQAREHLQRALPMQGPAEGQARRICQDGLTECRRAGLLFSHEFTFRRTGMITRDEIRELANFHSPETCALTFYYQPSTPQDHSHRDESILVKDMVRNALREAEKERQERLRPRRPGTYQRHGRGAAWQRRQSQGDLCLCRPELLARVRSAAAAAQDAGHCESALPSEAAGGVAARRPQDSALSLADRTKARVFEMSERRDHRAAWTSSTSSRVAARAMALPDTMPAMPSAGMLNEATQHFKAVAEY